MMLRVVEDQYQDWGLGLNGVLFKVASEGLRGGGGWVSGLNMKVCSTELILTATVVCSGLTAAEGCDVSNSCFTKSSSQSV